MDKVAPGDVSNSLQYRSANAPYSYSICHTFYCRQYNHITLLNVVLCCTGLQENKHRQPDVSTITYYLGNMFRPHMVIIRSPIIIKRRKIQLQSIHLVVCLTTGPKPLPNGALHTVRSRASSFNCEYPLLSLRSSSSFLRLLPRLPVTYIPKASSAHSAIWSFLLQM